MKNEDYIPDIERQDQIAIDEKKKEKEERRFEQNSQIANDFYEFHDEVQLVREFIDANCKPKR